MLSGAGAIQAHPMGVVEGGAAQETATAAPHQALAGTAVPVNTKLVKARITASRTTIDDGQSVWIRFTVTNKSKRAIKVLKWFTPFEGGFSDLFSVTQGKLKGQYSGILADRNLPPPPQAYLSIAAGGHATVKIKCWLGPAQISAFPPSGYILPALGQWHVRFWSKLQFTAARTPDANHLQSVGVAGDLVINVVAPK